MQSKTELQMDALYRMVNRILGRNAEFYTSLADRWAPQADGWNSTAPFMYKGMYFYVNPLFPNKLGFCFEIAGRVYVKSVSSKVELDYLIKDYSGYGKGVCISTDWWTFEQFEKLVKEMTSWLSRLIWPSQPFVLGGGRILWHNREWRVVEGKLQVKLPDGTFFTIEDKKAIQPFLSPL